MHYRRPGKIRTTIAVVALAASAWTPTTASFITNSHDGQNVRQAVPLTWQSVDEALRNATVPSLQSAWKRLSAIRDRVLGRFTKPAPPMVPAAQTIGDLFEKLPIRAFASELAASKDVQMANGGRRLLRWLDIAQARTPDERHAKIRALQITLRVSKSSVDGSVTKDFVEGGQTKVDRSLAPTLGRQRHSGPASDNCYDGEPEPCLTEQEMEDYLIFLYAAADELDATMAELDQEWAEYEDYCNNNPGQCDDVEEAVVPSGPSAWECAYFGWAGWDTAAVVQFGVTAYEAYSAIVVGEGAIAASAAVATASAAVTAEAITVGVLATAFWAYKFIQCKRAMIFHVAHMR